jgi:hypothetical protein
MWSIALMTCNQNAEGNHCQMVGNHRYHALEDLDGNGFSLNLQSRVLIQEFTIFRIQLNHHSRR